MSQTKPPRSSSTCGWLTSSPAMRTGRRRGQSSLRRRSTAGRRFAATCATPTDTSSRSASPPACCTASSRQSARRISRAELASRSGRAAADQPDGRGDEQHRQREQPAALDPLERPEPAGGLIAGPLRVAVLSEALPEAYRLRLAARSHRTRRARRAELLEEA